MIDWTLGILWVFQIGFACNRNEMNVSVRNSISHHDRPDTRLLYVVTNMKREPFRNSPEMSVGFFIKVPEVINLDFRDHQRVSFYLRMNVEKCNHVIIFIHSMTRDLAFDNFCKNRIFHTSSILHHPTEVFMLAIRGEILYIRCIPRAIRV